MERKIICNHEGLKEGVHIIHAVGCTVDEIQVPVVNPNLKPQVIGEHVDPATSEQKPLRAGGT